MVRLFVCVWVPDDIKKNIIEFQEKLIKLPLKAKFIEKENLHLTITFLGETRDEAVPEIESKLNRAVEGITGFHVKLKGLKIIPSEKYIRVIGVGVNDQDGMKRLITSIGGAIGGSYYESSKMTLCRVKHIQNKQAVGEFIEMNRDVDLGEFEVKSVALVKSVLIREGPVYKTVYEKVLG